MKKNRISLIQVQNHEKVKALLNDVDEGKGAVMPTNVEYLRCGEVEALRYFQLSDMRYNDGNVAAEKVTSTLLNLNICTNFRT